jgi:agmatinase
MTPLEELALLLKPAGGGLYLVSTGRAEQEALQRRFYDADSAADVTAKYLAQLSGVPDAKLVLLGIPSDVGAGFRRGANLGPQALRSRMLEDDPNFPQYCAERGVVDLGDVFVIPQLLHDDMLSPTQIARCQNALYPDVSPELRSALPVSPLSIAERALDLVFRINPRARPMLLGGDHSTAWPVVKALHTAQRRFCIVQLDAHTDLLAQRLGIDICFATWSYHANELIGRGNKLIQIGIRATRHPREHWENTLQVRQFWPEEYAGNEERLLEDVLAAVKATGLPAYLSNDIDGTDSAYADATGTPEPAGVSPDFVQKLIQRLAKEVGLLGGDVVEVAPLLGRDGGAPTLAVAARYARDTLDALLKT